MKYQRSYLFHPDLKYFHFLLHFWAKSKNIFLQQIQKSHKFAIMKFLQKLIYYNNFTFKTVDDIILTTIYHSFRTTIEPTQITRAGHTCQLPRQRDHVFRAKNCGYSIKTQRFQHYSNCCLSLKLTLCRETKKVACPALLICKIHYNTNYFKAYLEGCFLTSTRSASAFSLWQSSRFSESS